MKEVKSLEEIASFRRGLTFSKKDVSSTVTTKQVLRSNNIDLISHSLNLDDIANLQEDFFIPNEKKLHKGDIFICMSNGSVQHLGKVAYIDRETNFAFGGFMGTIHPFEEVVFPKYLFYCCCSSQYKYYLSSILNGININNLKWSDLSHFQVPVPPLAEQESIVAELDLLSSVIEKQKKQLEELDRLAQTIFYDMFGDPIENEKGWEVRKLGEVCKTTSGGTPSKNNPEYYNNGNIPWLRSGEVNQVFITKTELFITEEGLKNSSAKIIPVNSVAIAMYGATVGQVGIIKSEMCTNQAVCSILPDKHIVPIYLYYFLLGLKEEYLKLAIGGAQPNISQGIIKATQIGLPPLSLQQLFATKIEAIERQKAAIKKSMAETQKLFDYTMDKYFG